MASEEEKERSFFALVVALALIGGLLYLLKGKLPMGTYATKQPDRVVPESVPGTGNTFNNIWPDAIGEHFVHPHMIENPVVLPVRYPPRAGHEITTLIHHGYPALFQPRGELTTWVECPPSEVG